MYTRLLGAWTVVRVSFLWIIKTKTKGICTEQICFYEVMVRVYERWTSTCTNVGQYMLKVYETEARAHSMMVKQSIELFIS